MSKFGDQLNEVLQELMELILLDKLKEETRIGLWIYQK